MLSKKFKTSLSSQISNMNSHLDSEGFNECVQIVKSLLKLNRDYEQLRILAIDDAPTFFREAHLFAKNVLEIRQRIENFKTKYGESVSFDFDAKTGAFGVCFSSATRRVSTHPIRGENNIPDYKSLRVKPELLRALGFSTSQIPNVNDVLQESLRKVKNEEKVELLRPREAAKMVGVSYKTLWRWWKEGKMKAIQLPSGRLRYYKNELEKYIQKK
ncbi:MAG: helix-turn-helix domain-containing protein [Candidatus Bathyarchaeaceae archaeon]